MKKICIFLLTIFSAFVINSTIIFACNAEFKDVTFKSKYETWNFKGSEEELIKYYIENDIRTVN